MSLPQSPQYSKNQVEYYTSPFAKLRATRPTKSLQNTTIKLGPLNNCHIEKGADSLSGIRERKTNQRVELEYVGDYKKTRLTTLAAKFVHKHCTSTKKVVTATVNSVIHQSSLDYQRMNLLQAAAKDGGKKRLLREFEPEAVRMLIRISAALPKAEIENAFKALSQPTWHLDTALYVEDQIREEDVNSVYNATFLGRPTCIIRPPSSLADPVLVAAIGTFRACPRDEGEHPENVKMLNRELKKPSRHPGEYLESVQVGDIIRFSWGQGDSAVHASGNRDLGRIVVLLSFGRRGELVGRWEVGYRLH
ncbi:hypothetical protein HYFRA_00007768 [Hymenoscyphus fraxineus]|uniref:Uncharacterized protein n=1 Tax=Hymenoscyphus fraxineus TaxID=746836 RepID=A0A9N9PK75_9HELO|nr:hypothetical protein HYFRA_00007768 [Hymenoscyphus fraxineus]